MNAQTEINMAPAVPTVPTLDDGLDIPEFLRRAKPEEELPFDLDEEAVFIQTEEEIGPEIN